MPLTPADVHNVAFSKPPIGKPAYPEHEVDAFVDLIEAELARLIEDNHELCNQLETLDQRAHAAPIDTAASPHPVGPAQPGMAPVPPPTREPVWAGEDPNGHAARVLGMAQQMANQLASEAQAEADTMLNDARLSAEQLLAEAQAKAQGRVTEARTRAETMLEDARARAETLEQQSRDKAAAQQHQAARQHTEIITALTEEKNALENGIKELRAFERAYRASVVSYVQSQLHQLSGHQPPNPANPRRAPQGSVTSRSGAPKQSPRLADCIGSSPCRVPGGVSPSGRVRPPHCCGGPPKNRASDSLPHMDQASREGGLAG